MIRRILMCLAVMSAVSECAVPHHLRHRSGELLEAAAPSDDGSAKDRRSLQPGLYGKVAAELPDKDRIPYSYKKLDKMMKKAILQIILGELHPADMLLLKALNYTLEEVMAIREHELSRIKEEEELAARAKKQREQEALSAKYQAAMHRRSSSARRGKPGRESSFEAYNKQAVYDYENGATAASKSDYDESRLEYEDTAQPTEESFRQNFDRAMEPHVVFKIRYDDSEFDSGSDERARGILKNHRTKSLLKLDKPKSSGSGESFQALGLDGAAASAAAAAAAAVENLQELNKQAVLDYESLLQTDGEEPTKEPEVLNVSAEERNESATTEETTTTEKRVSEYEGLEWVGGDVYRVKPEAMEALLNYEDELAAAAEYENRDDEEEEHLRQTLYSSLDELVNDTDEYQNDAADASTLGNFTDNQNLTSYQRLTLAQRRENFTSTFDSQGQKAIEDIKLRVLALTGRFNLTSSNNQVQREKLTMFSPTCQVPRNTDVDAWSDPFSMNMHFQLNLTAGEHVLAAKLRLFKLPQETYTSTSSSTYEEDEEDEKKIRVSVYFYTKSLKKHRVKKRLMDSIVTPLTSQGAHLALDVRQSLRFWRPSSQTPHSGNSNHGLVVQVEDQDGRPLKPALYIQQPSCNQAAGSGMDDKISTSLPFSSEPVLVTFAS